MDCDTEEKEIAVIQAIDDIQMYGAVEHNLQRYIEDNGLGMCVIRQAESADNTELLAKALALFS